MNAIKCGERARVAALTSPCRGLPAQQLGEPHPRMSESPPGGALLRGTQPDTCGSTAGAQDPIRHSSPPSSFWLKIFPCSGLARCATDGNGEYPRQPEPQKEERERRAEILSNQSSCQVAKLGSSVSLAKLHYAALPSPRQAGRIIQDLILVMGPR